MRRRGRIIRKMRCVILAAGPVENAEILCPLLRPDDWVIAADGGVRLAGRLGIQPNLIVADFDSAKPDELSSDEVPQIRMPVEKDLTDTMAAAAEGLKRGFRDFLLLGCTGGRLDHTQACIAVMHYLLNRGAHAILADEHNRLELHIPGRFTVEPREFWKLSLLPYAGNVSGLTVKNAAYPLENKTLVMDDTLGISNEFLEGPVEISFQEGILMVFLSKD